MTDVKVGDKVRVTVTHEGKISRIDSYGIRVEGWGLVGPSDEGTTVEIIERAKPKVGDLIEGRDSYTALPVGTILTSTTRPGNLTDIVIVDECCVFRDGRGKAIDTPYCKRVIVSVPEG